MPLPKYVEAAGYPIGRLPYVAQDALLHCFVLNGDRPRLQTLCTRVLTTPSGGSLAFHAASSAVLLTSLYVPNMKSGDVIDSTKGYVRETDTGFWILTYGGDALAPWTWKFRWMPAYLFVDCGAAIVGGREAFGFPKILGEIVRASNADDDPNMTVRTLRVVSFGPDKEGTVGDLFAVQPQAAAAPTPSQPLAAALNVFRNAMQQFAGMPLPGNAFSQLQPPYAMGMPMVFLKQFADIATPVQACYQAITEAKAETDAISDAGTFASPLELKLFASDSHPIGEVLGLTDGQAVSAAFWLKQNFTQGFGKTLWEAP